MRADYSDFADFAENGFYPYKDFQRLHLITNMRSAIDALQSSNKKAP
tara:strand:+ start:343 stop:483 length:141 start_codon:yes stop_codon:yes gene_type:complete